MLNDKLYIKILESIVSNLHPLLCVKFEEVNIADSDTIKIFQIGTRESKTILGKEDIFIYIPKVDIAIYKEIFEYVYYSKYRHFLGYQAGTLVVLTARRKRGNSLSCFFYEYIIYYMYE